MSLLLNLIELGFDSIPLSEIMCSEYQEQTFNTLRSQDQGSGFVMRIGNEIWGFSLSKSVASMFGFKALASTRKIDPRFINGLLRRSLKERMKEIGYITIGLNKFRLPNTVAFTLGDEYELVAQRQWLIRPFDLPYNDSDFFTLLLNPTLSYRFKQTISDVSKNNIDWKAFGPKVRALSDEEIKAGASWETAHTVNVVEELESNQILCEFWNGEQQVVDFESCWILASPQNRFKYLNLRYPKDAELRKKAMKAKADEFALLDRVKAEIVSIGKLIEFVKLNEIHFKLGSLLELGLVEGDGKNKYLVPPLRTGAKDSVHEDPLIADFSTVPDTEDFWLPDDDMFDEVS